MTAFRIVGGSMLLAMLCWLGEPPPAEAQGPQSIETTRPGSRPFHSRARVSSASLAAE